MPRLERGTYQNPRGDRTKKSIEEHVKGMRKNRTFQYKKNDRGKIIKIPMLTGGQAKIAAKAPPPNKIDEKDFAVLRAEKAKGRGMGLQDESVKPGKVMKAKRGTGVLAEKGKSNTFSGYSKPFKGPQHKGRVATIVGVKPGAKIKGQKKKFKSMEEMRKAKGFKPGETAKDFNKRRMMLAGAKEAAKATRIGKIVLPIAAAGVAAQQYLKSKMKKKNKKMGGGMMMQRPMGYALGGVGAAQTRKKDLQRGPTKGQAAARPKKNKLSLGRTQYKTYTKELDTQFDKAERLQKSAKGASPTIKANLEKKIRKSPLFKTNEIVSSSKRDASKTFLNVGGMMEDRKSEGRRERRAKIIKKIMGVKPGAMGTEAGRVAKKVVNTLTALQRDGTKVKKMGGGMMQKPMGYKKGVMVMARGCKLGRKKATKIT